MTACTICGLPCPGTDLDDEACCQSCHTANLAGAELRPLAWVQRGPAEARARVAQHQQERHWNRREA